MENKNKVTINLVIVLIILVLGLGGYITYDKILNNSKTVGCDNNQDSNEPDENKANRYNYKTRELTDSNREKYKF